MSADLSEVLDTLAAVPELSDGETAAAVTCIARHSGSPEEITELCAMLGLDGAREPKAWMPSAGRAVPDSFRRRTVKR